MHRVRGLQEGDRKEVSRWVSTGAWFGGAVGLWLVGWMVAKIVSIRKGWDKDLVEDTWVRSCCLAAGLVAVLHFWTLMLLPLILWAYKDAEAMSEKARIRAAQRAAYDVVEPHAVSLGAQMGESTKEGTVIHMNTI